MKAEIKRVLFISCIIALTVVFIFIVIAYNSKPITVFAGIKPAYPTLILDAGHGGFDGGAVSKNGNAESGLNLDITLKTKDILRFFGIVSALTRTDEGSLAFDEAKSIRENKNADIKARFMFSESMPDCDFISIHLNNFEDAVYRGAQVFWGLRNEHSQLLAKSIQSAMLCLNESNKRKAAPSRTGVYLMKNISAPAVTVECGFLSNPDEEKLLLQPGYRTKAALAISKGYLDYIKER